MGRLSPCCKHAYRFVMRLPAPDSGHGDTPEISQSCRVLQNKNAGAFFVARAAPELVPSRPGDRRRARAMPFFRQEPINALCPVGHRIGRAGHHWPQQANLMAASSDRCVRHQKLPAAIPKKIFVIWNLAVELAHATTAPFKLKKPGRRPGFDFEAAGSVRRRTPG
jgi:hypothetical protein